MVMVEIEEMKSQIEMVKHEIFDISFEESVATSDEIEYI
jgi:hypothetical protein